MELSLSRVHFPTTTLGPGRHLGVWFQGCSICCPGYVSADTQGPGQRRIASARLLTDIQPQLEQVEGITASGSGPFEQFAALFALLGELCQRSRIDILTYSGYPLGHLHAQLEQAAGLIGALISDPYQQYVEQSLALRGSDNQHLNLLTDLDRSCPDGYQRSLCEDDEALDPMSDHDGSMWMAGIPRCDSLLRLQDLLREQGHRLNVNAHRSR